MMKQLLTLLLLTLLLAACAPESVTPEPVPTGVPILPAPAGTTEYDGCAFRVHYPPELTLDASGWYAFFTAPDDPSVQMSIQAERKTGGTAEEVATALAQGYPEWTGELDLEPVEVIDFRGQPLLGVQGEFLAGETHGRLLVVIRPETLLGDMLPDDVVYTLIANSSESNWSQWEPHFDIAFQTFHPWDCGGV